jgi:hypothetical protein
LPRDADLSAARAAFKHFAKLLHPDKTGQDNKQAEDAFVHVRCDICSCSCCWTLQTECTRLLRA